MAPLGEVNSVSALVSAAQAVIRPASESKMKWAAVPLWSLNPEVGLNTMPVGAPPGMLTARVRTTGLLPRTPPVYSVDRSVPLSLTHNGDVGDAARPHGLTRLWSVTRATPPMSETRLLWW